MNAEELRHEVFELLYEKLVVHVERPELFVGLQGDKIVVLQPGGQHLAVLVVDGKLE